MGVKSIIFERNDESLKIYISNKSKILYKDISKTIDNNVIFKYLELLFNIIDNWQEKYIDTKIIDGDYWKLSITYIDDSKKEFYGKSNYPTNFEAFERLNQNLIYGESKWII